MFQLVTKYKELEREKDLLKARVREMEKQILHISHELCILKAHPCDWIALGFEDFGHYILPRIWDVIDLAGQGAYLFCDGE